MISILVTCPLGLQQYVTDVKMGHGELGLSYTGKIGYLSMQLFCTEFVMFWDLSGT